MMMMIVKKKERKENLQKVYICLYY